MSHVPHLDLTDRQKREQAFYSQYADRQRVERVDYAPAVSSESRPWNAYWYVYEYFRKQDSIPSKRLLDFGCGAGIGSLRFARMGYQVEGFDISPENLDVARDLALREGLADRIHYTQMVAEQLEYADNTFDCIAGIDILHHVDIPQAIAQAYRVLKPGGVALFKEHVEVPVYDRLRHTRLVEAVFPTESSLDEHITEDERKMNAADIAVINETFDEVIDQRFTLLARFDRMIPHCTTRMRGRLQAFDRALLRALPPLRTFAGTSVFVCRKAAQTGT